MAIVTMILGNSGEGKSYSLKHLDPSLTAVINVMNKPLSFLGAARFNKRIKSSRNPVDIFNMLQSSQSPIIVIDDFQYIMSGEFMDSVTEKLVKDAVFQKYNILAYNIWSIMQAAINLPNHKRVYILSHTQEENGRTKIKTIGKLLDDKVVLEGLVTTVLQTTVRDDGHFFMTQNNGFNTVKSPEGMFDSDLIPNDLNAVDDAICEYYGILKTGSLPAQDQSQKLQTA